METIKYSRTVCFFFSLSLFILGGCNDKNSLAAGEEAWVKVTASCYTKWLYEEKYDELWDKSSTKFKQTYGSVKNFTAYTKLFLDQLGEETEVIDERTFSIHESKVYERAANFQNLPMPVSVEWGLDTNRNIVWFDIRALPEEALSQFSDYRTKTDIQLPFKSEWLVIWGGRSIRDNYHADTPNQRYAYDFVIAKNGIHYDNEGSKNEDHYCFGQPIVAPGAGVVLSAENDVLDNLPSEENLEQPLGNYVLIDHENGEYSFLAHFRRGTVTVHAGDRVASGTLLGECGNSGGSDLPHLHYHIQNTPYVQDNMAEVGLPIQFQSFYANGDFVKRGEPIRWQLIHP